MKKIPVSKIRKLLEPGPVVLVSSSWKGKTNIMTMGWHMVLSEEPSLIACMIWDQNYSHDFIRKSKECVINIPAASIAEKVVRIGNCSGRDEDKFEKFGLTAVEGKKVSVPSIKECFAHIECKLVDSSKIKKYNLFIFEVVYAQINNTPKYPMTIHYRGDGEFMVSGKTISRYKKLFRPDYL